jgi:hypothetical protein
MHMPLTNKPAYYQEATGWLRILDHLRQEHVRLKNRIADFIRNDVNNNTLDQAELMLNSIINKEAAIALLKSDVVRHLNEKANEDAAQTQAQLREDIRKMESELQRLAAELTAYIESATPA